MSRWSLWLRAVLASTARFSTNSNKVSRRHFVAYTCFKADALCLWCLYRSWWSTKPSRHAMQHDLSAPLASTSQLKSSGIDTPLGMGLGNHQWLWDAETAERRHAAHQARLPRYGCGRSLPSPKVSSSILCCRFSCSHRLDDKKWKCRVNKMLL